MLMPSAFMSLAGALQLDISSRIHPESRTLARGLDHSDTGRLWTDPCSRLLQP